MSKTSKSSTNSPRIDTTRLADEVGSRLGDRRSELGLTIREVAEAADVSPGHLSDIEHGLSQVSLPVLIRVVRALELTMGELLPLLGGHSVRRESTSAIEAGDAAVLSHDDLLLSVRFVRLKPKSIDEFNVQPNHDVAIHVLRGEVDVESDGERNRLAVGDTIDTEFVIHHKIIARRASDLIIASGERHD